MLSEKIPVAVNCWDVPKGMLGIAGFTSTDVRVAGVTIMEEVPETFPDTAVMVVDPAETVVANPFVPAALLIAATAEFEETHDADAVRS